MIRSYLATLWAVLFVSCGPNVAQSVAVFDFELIDMSLEGAMRGARPDEQERLARLSDQLQQLLKDSGRFSVVDITPVAREAQASNLQACGGCDFGQHEDRAFYFRPDQVQPHIWVYLLRAWAMPPDIRRALELLASARQGRSADVLAYDVGPEVLLALVRAGLASQAVEHLAVPGGQPIEITRVRITDAGRQAFRALKAVERPGPDHRSGAAEESR
jgi:hypothetical protein